MTVPSSNPAGAAGTITIGDMTVNRMGYGAMRLPGPGVWGEPADRAAALSVLRRAVELGVDLIDTAPYYGLGVADRLIAEALYPYPADLVIVTKVGARRGEDRSWLPAARPDDLRATTLEALNNLRLERLDLVHFRFSAESGVPFTESFAAMARLQDEGLIRHLGISNIGIREMVAARDIAAVVSVQNMYSVAQPQGEDVLEACTVDGIAFMPFFPLAMGQLDRTGAAVAAVAERRGVTPAQVALAWLLARAPVMLPIPGTSSIAHLEENIAAAALRLSDEEMRRIGG